MRIIILAGLLLAGCATNGFYRAPQGGMNCAPGKKMTRGNCGMTRASTPMYGTVEGAECSYDLDCQYGQYCRKANGNLNPGICINRN